MKSLAFIITCFFCLSTPMKWPTLDMCSSWIFWDPTGNHYIDPLGNHLLEGQQRSETILKRFHGMRMLKFIYVYIWYDISFICCMIHRNLQHAWSFERFAGRYVTNGWYGLALWWDIHRKACHMEDKYLNSNKPQKTNWWNSMMPAGL